MGKFHFIQTALPGVVIVEPTVYGDSRGYFMETYQAEEFAACGVAGPFVQPAVCCAGCIFKNSIRRASWCA